MPVALTTLVQEADRFLDAARIADYCPNGLQVEGRPQVARIVSGVTASQALLDAAVQAQADVVLVHHGYFWKNEDARVVGMKQRRLKTLLSHDISLLAYHLPLDVHPEVGNNAQLAALLGLSVEGRWSPVIRGRSAWSARCPSRWHRASSRRGSDRRWAASR